MKTTNIILKVDLLDRTVSELVSGDVIKRNATMSEIGAEMLRRKTLVIKDISYPRDEIAIIKKRDYSDTVKIDYKKLIVLTTQSLAIIGITWVFVSVSMVLLD